MARSVIVVSDDPQLMESVRSALLSDVRFMDACDGLHCDGSMAPLTNIYPIATEAVGWDAWDPDQSEPSDPATMSALILECRAPEWIAEIGRLVAQSLTRPVWFVDAADTAWPAGLVDEERIVLA